MTSRGSRYQPVPEVAARDSRSRAVAAGEIRELPATPGRFRHLLTQGDRLDALAARYYGDSRRWWRICDANPTLRSPMALVGDEPIMTTRLPLELASPDAAPPWADLLTSLNSLPGVLAVRIEERWGLVPSAAATGIVEEHCVRAVVVQFNRLLVELQVLSAAAESAGFRPGAPERSERVGQEIIIPPA